jgi:single-strand selective monofunctional uracil DNA glycosylase
MASLVSLAKELRAETSALSFPGVPFVYEPLDYAWTIASSYLRTYGAGQKRVLLLGMNPGPFGMGQTGVPFGEVSFVRDWMKLSGKVKHPATEHPKRPILGLASTRSEVSGKRLWSLFAKAHPSASTFFEQAFVMNYCPLLFLGETGANLTPDKLPKAARARLERICDEHLRAAIRLLSPELVIGVGGYAGGKIESLALEDVKTGTIPHPSPASPSANKDWDGQAKRALEALGAGFLLEPRRKRAAGGTPG